MEEEMEAYEACKKALQSLEKDEIIRVLKHLGERFNLNPDVNQISGFPDIDSYFGLIPEEE